MGESRLVTALPFDGKGVMRYLANHAVPGVESGDGTAYRRNIRRDDGSVAKLTVSMDGPDAVRVGVDGGAIPPELMGRVRQLFDLDADSAAIDMLLAEGPELAPTVAQNPGIRVPGSLDPNEQLLRTMVGQQISISAARTVLGGLAAELDGTGTFPTAEMFAQHGLDFLRGPAARVAAIHGVAVALASGSLVIDGEMPVEELTHRLVAFPGIGPWTAGYVAMRVLGAGDILLSTDLVLRKGAALLGLPTDARELDRYAKRWSPYRTYAGLHLWRVAQTHEPSHRISK